MKESQEVLWNHEKHYLPNIIQYMMELLKNYEGETRDIIENIHCETYYDCYHKCALNHIVNSNIYRSPINHIATIQVKNPIMTKNKYFKFQLKYIFYSHLHIHQPRRNSYLKLYSADFNPKTASKIFKSMKSLMSRTLSVIMMHEDYGAMTHRVLA